MIKGLAHACFTVSDLAKSVEFYCDGLGLRHGFDFRRENGELFGVYLHAGERTFIELFEGEIAGSTEGTSYGHICFEVDDLEATVGDLRGKGIEISDPKKGIDNSWQSWLADPDGNRIELHCYTDESKQLGAMR